MSHATRTLVVGFFPRPFCGEAAQYELGLNRLPVLVDGTWGIVWVELDRDDHDTNVRKMRDAGPDLVLLHANRTQMVETVAFVGAMGEELPDLLLVLCGWVGQPAYVDACFATAGGLRHPRFAVACGEVEAIVPPLLDRLGEARGERALDGLAGIVTFEPEHRAWRGSADYVLVEDMDELPSWSAGRIDKEWRESRAGWVELSRGCKYRCAFCFASCYRNARMRRRKPEQVRDDIRLAADEGVEVLGLYTASVSLDIELVQTVVETVRELRLDDVAVVGALGPIDKKFIGAEELERLSRLSWSVMTVGLQSITPEAIKASRRPDDEETFARTMEYLSGFVTPEVELILGLPGDSPEGFRRTIDFALSLPVNVTVQTFRLDPWSSHFEDRERLGLRADFRNVARVTEGASFPPGAIEECKRWLRSLGDGPWTHRARHLALDGQQIDTTQRHRDRGQQKDR